MEILKNQKIKNEEKIKKRIEDVNGEIYEIRAYNESFLTKIEEERNIIKREAELNFLSEVEPIKSKHSKNQLEIEEIKKEINMIKTEFEKLREGIIETARNTEKRAKEETNIKHEFDMRNLVERIRENEEIIDEIKEKVEQGDILSKGMRSKFDYTKDQLYKAEAILGDSDKKFNSVIEDQREEIGLLEAQKEGKGREIVEMIEEVEEEKVEISQKLEEFEDEYERIERENRARMKLLDEHLEIGIGRIKQLDDAVKGFESESRVLREKNKELALKLKERLNLVLEMNFKG